MSWSKQTVVGIFSRSGEHEYLWLVNALRDVTNLCPQPFVITNSNASAFRESVYTNTFAILYHSMNRGSLNITDVTDSLYDDELQVLSSILGKDKVVVIADDLVDSSHNAKNRILHSQPTIRLKALDLFLFSREDKTNYNILLSKMAPIKEIVTAASHKSINMWDEEKDSPDKEKDLKPRKVKMSSSKQTVVGIFSRSRKDEYLWLVNALRDDTNICLQPFVITNSNASAFRESVYTNNFAILYHSMNSGRLNITDVTDSLYDDELQVLSSILGKDKVMVIADDPVDSSHNAKNRILHSQPTIKLKAQDLFLFSREDKTNNNILISKMAPIKEIITAASHKSINMNSTLVSLICYAANLVTLRWACSDPTFKNLSLLFACTTISPWIRRYMRVPDSSVSLSLVTYGTTVICVGNALCRPSVWNWALAFPWVAASLGLVRNTFYIPYIPAGLRLSETYMVPAGVVTILSISQPDWPHVLSSYCNSILQKHKGR
ncbi:uncharacterized protein LOC121398309 isoform X3 [Xenopus laevis]|uniref:Uncharacterized protein LOC121398309 isoform X3 n=1 Tax=Xenopus laevis TaxID=8355 RepID=A0A8J1LUX6_XENLA|nr:uncharacterized protein LOC121398309 isoform X3 [Xenopus laevis]